MIKTFKKKIFSIFILTISIILIAFFYFIMPLVKNTIISQKKIQLVNVVDVAHSIISKYNSDYKAGKITLAKAQSKSINIIKNIRYGSDRKDYLWINDYYPKMIVHPYRPDLNGVDLSKFSDPYGKRIFKEIVNICKNHKSGFIDYMWQWKDNRQRIAPKISYVKSFKEWGWIIGTGAYIEDIDSAFQFIVIRSIVVFSIIFLISTILLIIYLKSHKTLSVDTNFSELLNSRINEIDIDIRNGKIIRIE